MTTNGEGSTTVSPAKTTSYQLGLENNGAIIQSSVTVVVDEAPIVESFSASPMIIVPGSEAILEWVVAGAESVTIEPGLGSLEVQGTMSVSPDETTTYSLTAVNGNGSRVVETTVTVDAIQASLTRSFDAAAPKQASGAIFDVISGASFDLKTTELDTQIESFTTTLTAAYRLTEFGGASGGDGNSFPGGTTSYETWVRTGELDANPQVIFETGGSSDGSSLLISADAVEFFNSLGGERTHVVRVPLSEINLSDFIHIVATLDQSSGELVLYVQGSAGGKASSRANGALGLPNGRASLFNWTNFSAGVAGALGGIASEVPEGVTLFRGELALLNIYDRALSAEEIDIMFRRIAIPDPGLIQSFTASPERASSGDTVTLSWQVGDVQGLTLIGEGGGDVLPLTQDGVGTVEVQLNQSARYSLVAESADGNSTASLMVLIDVADGVVLLKQSTESWETGNAWADGGAPTAGNDYLVTDFVASSLGAPGDIDVSFAGDSLEILGAGARLRLSNELTDRVTIDDLRLSGGSLEFLDGEGSLTLEGGLTVRRDSEIDIRGSFNTLLLDSRVSGVANLTVTAAATALDEDETLIINGNNSSFQGGWTFTGGRTFVSGDGALGSGDLLLINANLEIDSNINSPDAGVIVQGNSTLSLFNDATFHRLNIRFTDGTSVAVPAGSYSAGTWPDAAAALGVAGLVLDLVGGTQLTILDSLALPTLGSVFTGEGNWSSVANWSDGVPVDGSNAIVNGIAEISGNIGTSNADNPSRIFVGDNATGVLNVTGGTLSGAHSGTNAGIFVGLGPDGDGRINIAEGAALRSQGGGMVVQIGDDAGGQGHISIAGQLFNFKFFEIVNGTLEMLPSAINNSFNDVDVSVVGSGGTLAYVIDGEQVGGLIRSNTTGLQLVIDPGASLKVTLEGAVSEGQSWVLIDYTTLEGSFVQGSQFTNEQGHELEVDYGSGDSDTVTLTLKTLNPLAPPTTNTALEFSLSNDLLQIDFTGRLQFADEVAGPYSDIEGATSPYEVDPSEGQGFFRSIR